MIENESFPEWSSERQIVLGENLPAIPETLLLDQSEGKVLFVAGAGVSSPSRLPSFRELVLEIYKEMDWSAYQILKNIENGKECKSSDLGDIDLNPEQKAEVIRYSRSEYDVVLGMLERRIGRVSNQVNKFRQVVNDYFNKKKVKPSSLHRSLIKLSDRGESVAIATTNFDHLFEAVLRANEKEAKSYTQENLPRPSLDGNLYSGVFHIHGAVSEKLPSGSELILTDQDFGLNYLRHRSVSDFLFDVSRLFTIVFIGYKTGDPPMKYLLSAIAADSNRFNDIRPRYIFVGEQSSEEADISLADWRSRGLVPIFYDKENGHKNLELLLKRWSDLAAVSSGEDKILKELVGIAKKPRGEVEESKRDLFDHLIRRSSHRFRIDVAEKLASRKAAYSWLDAIVRVSREKHRSSSEFSGRSRERYLSNLIDVFISSRLQDAETIDWILEKQSSEKLERLATLGRLKIDRGNRLEEPWVSVWAMIEEMWRSERSFPLDASLSKIRIQKRLNAGERSLALILSICENALPVITLVSRNNIYKGRRRKKKIKGFRDLFLVSVSDCSSFEPEYLSLNEIDGVDFLVELFLRLESGLRNLVDTTKYYGLNDRETSQLFGGVNRVNFLKSNGNSSRSVDPDRFSSGVAHACKLMCAILERMIEIESAAASNCAKKLDELDISVYLRIKAFLYKNDSFANTETCEDFLLSLGSEEFWSTRRYPEVTELWVKRFKEMNQDVQSVILRRIRKGPPLSYFNRKFERDKKVKLSKRYSAIAAQRLKLIGVDFSDNDEDWFSEIVIANPDVCNINTWDYDFPIDVIAIGGSTKVDPILDKLSGLERIERLYDGFKSWRFDVDDGDEALASNWMNIKNNHEKVIEDLSSVSAFTDECYEIFDTLLNRVAFSAEGERDTVINRRIRKLVKTIDQSGLIRSIGGISDWFEQKSGFKLSKRADYDIWISLWGPAVESTNKQHAKRVRSEVYLIGANESRPEIDTINGPVAKLVELFIRSCPKIGPGKNPFSRRTRLREMRDLIIDAKGHAGAICRIKLIEYIGYFMEADSDWTNEKLISELKIDKEFSLDLWVGISRTSFTDKFLEKAGEDLLKACRVSRLGREHRRNLIYKIVWHCLFAFRGDREPSIDTSRVMQMIRSLGDDVRRYPIDALVKFFRDLTAAEKLTSKDDDLRFRAKLYDQVSERFFSRIWPRELSYNTKEISAAISCYPAETGFRFSNAVSEISQLVIPFDCWAVHDFGFFDEDTQVPSLSQIVKKSDAKSLLTMLNLGVGKSVDSIVPYDLDTALVKIVEVSPDLEQDPRFVRLKIAARKK